MKVLLLKFYYILLQIKDNILILYNKLIISKMKSPIVKDTDETLYKIIENKYSISRYGDGEFSLMYGESLMFQPVNNELVKRLREIIMTSNKNHLVCIPNVFDSVSWLTEKAGNYWTKYLNLNKNKIYRVIDRKKVYYDTQVTRLYIDIRDKSKVRKRFNKIKLLWDSKDIVIVEGEKSRLGVGNDLFVNAKSIERIICPSIDAFSKYSQILEIVKEQDKEKLILIALGPTATVLAYDLSKIGYQAVDIGHIDIEYEWFLKGVTEKCTVKNKYIGEVNGGSKVADIIDYNYEKQIICKIL